MSDMSVLDQFQVQLILRTCTCMCVFDNFQVGLIRGICVLDKFQVDRI